MKIKFEKLKNDMENNGYGNRYMNGPNLPNSANIMGMGEKIENLGRKWPYNQKWGAIHDHNWHRRKTAEGTKIRDIRTRGGGSTDSNCRFSGKIGRGLPLYYARYYQYNNRNRYSGAISVPLSVVRDRAKIYKWGTHRHLMSICGGGAATIRQ